MSGGNRRTTDLNRYARYAHLGIQFALVIGICLFGGVKLDQRLGNRGIFTLLGTFVGAGIGIYVLFKEVQRAEREDPSDSSGRNGGTSPPGGDPDRSDRRP